MKKLLKLLEDHRSGKVGSEVLVDYLRKLPFERFGKTTYDSHREIRTGMKEVIYAPGKTLQQLAGLIGRSMRNHSSAMVTRIDEATARKVMRRLPGGRYHRKGRILAYGRGAYASRRDLGVAVVTAGAADEDVAEEAALTLEHHGWKVRRIYDVGVAGIHRLLGHAQHLEQASAIIVVAGMEGALASVVAGLTSRPVIAVPTSCGYGASFGGVAPLLSMLNSCAGGVAVVNIDSGFNAACLAHKLCMTIESRRAGPTRAGRK